MQKLDAHTQEEEIGEYFVQRIVYGVSYARNSLLNLTEFTEFVIKH